MTGELSVVTSWRPTRSGLAVLISLAIAVERPVVRKLFGPSGMPSEMVAASTIAGSPPGAAATTRLRSAPRYRLRVMTVGCEFAACAALGRRTQIREAAATAARRRRDKGDPSVGEAPPAATLPD